MNDDINIKILFVQIDKLKRELNILLSRARQLAAMEEEQVFHYKDLLQHHVNQLDKLTSIINLHEGFARH